MLETTTLTDEPLAYPFLLLTHLVCADQQIHNQELLYLRQLERTLEIGQATLEEKEKILSQDEQMLSVEVVAKKIVKHQRDRLMKQMLTLAHIDGFYSPLEKQMIEQVGQIWNYSVFRLFL